MGPTSKYLIVLVLLLTVGLFFLTARTRRWFYQVPAAVLAFTLSVFTGILIVNYFYGYYTTWGAAIADLTNSGNSYAISHGVTAKTGGISGSGKLEHIELAGRLSGIHREGLVYLPPQYFDKQYADVRFPVLELIHGTPGDPAQWVNEVRVIELVETMINQRRIGPMVIVMPDSNGGVRRTEECLNTPQFKDDTYMSDDVPNDIRARFRVSQDTAQWGTIGDSSGGYCAANLMMRHPTSFGSAASIDGYFTPYVENASHIIGREPSLQRVNDPLAAALALPPGHAPLVPFFAAAGSGDASDYTFAKTMVDAMRRLESVPFLVVPKAHHTMAAVRSMMPSALAWSWEQLATPDQKRMFPTFTSSLGLSVTTAPLKNPIPAPVIHIHHRKHHPTPSSSSGAPAPHTSSSHSRRP